MLSLEESLKILKETNALIEGHFILSSGFIVLNTFNVPINEQTSHALKICESLAEKIKIN